MTNKINNPLDDELLKELGLEPRQPAPQASAPKVPPREQPNKPKVPPAQNMPPVQKDSLPVNVKVEPKEESESFSQGLKDLAQDMPVQVVAVLGKRTMTLKDIISIKQGEVIELKKLPHESIDLVANGKLVAKGELVLIDGKLGIQVKQLVE